MGTFIAPPQATQPGPIPQAPHLPAPEGTTPYAPSAAGQVFQASNNFVQSFLAMKSAKQEAARRQYFENVQLIAAGLGGSLDLHKVAKQGIQGGIPLRSTPFTPEEQQYQQQSQAYAQSQATGGPQTPPIDPALAAMVPGVAAAAQQGAQQFAPQPPGAPPPAPVRPGFWDQAKAFLAGRGSQITDQSPAVQDLQKLQTAGSVGGGFAGDVASQRGLSVLQNRFQGLDMGQKMQMIQIGAKAMAGDPQARDILVRTGLWKNLPADEVTQYMQMAYPQMPQEEVKQRVGSTMLWLQTGGPQMLGYQQALIKDMLPRFGGDITKAAQYVMNPVGSGLQPGMTPDESEKFANAWNKIYEMNPKAPSNLAAIGAMGLIGGQPGLFDKVVQTINDHYETSGQTSASQFAETAQTNRYNAQSERLRANVDLGGLQQRISNENSLLDLAKLRAIADAAGDQGKIAMDMLNRPNATAQDQKNALDMLASAVSKKSNLSVNYRGQEFKIADPVRAIQDLPWYKHQYVTNEQGLQVMKPDDSFWGGQAPPMTYGSHPQTTQYLNQLRSLFANKSAAERQAIIHNSLKPSDPTGEILDFLRQQSGDQSQEPQQ